MQTFLTYPSFTETARCLDYKRLGKQRVEAKQIYLALTKKNYGWKNHPAVKMWRGSELSLLCYGASMCYEWRMRGYEDSLYRWFLRAISKHRTKGDENTVPSWFFSRRFHQAHRSNLVRKDWRHYRKYFPRIKNNLPYIWPVK